MLPSSPSKILNACDCKAFLVSDLTNIRYLTGVSMSAGVLLVSPRAMTLFADGRYAEIAQKNARKGIAVDAADRFESAMKKTTECGFEEDDVTVGTLLRWKRKYSNTKFVRTSGVIEGFRRQKDDDELRHLAKAERITKELLRRVPTVLRVNVTEREIAWKLETWARELGAEEMSFPPIVAFGTHTARPHHQPTTRSLKKGHVVQVDCGAKVKGYCGDMSMVYFTQKPTPVERAVFDAVAEARDAAIEKVKAGASTADLDRLARSILKKHELDQFFTHSLGHGVGLDVHEGPILSSRRPAEALLRREVVTIEPGVYLPGKFGMRLEEMVVVE